MAAECVKRTCDNCGYTLQARDCKTIIVGELPGHPSEGDQVVHCICYQCGQEWVE